MIVFTKVAEKQFSPSFRHRILQVHSLFPELQEREIKCGFIRKGSVLAGSAISWARPQRIAFQSSASSTTIAHELVHLVQGNKIIPHGEKACDIWALARLPVEMIDERPYYLLGHWSTSRWMRHKESVRQLCIRAIEVRNKDRAYIKWLSGRFRQLR